MSAAELSAVPSTPEPAATVARSAPHCSSRRPEPGRTGSCGLCSPGGPVGAVAVLARTDAELGLERLAEVRRGFEPDLDRDVGDRAVHQAPVGEIAIGT